MHPRPLSVDTDGPVSGTSELRDNGALSANERTTVSASIQAVLTLHMSSFAFAVGTRDGCIFP